MAGANGSDARTVVAVLGAGIMGSAMARNLVAAGPDHAGVGPVSRGDRVRWPTRARSSAASARDAVRDAGVVITMLPTADAVNSVIFDGGVAAALADGCVWAQMGTIGVEATLADPGPAGRAAGPASCSWTPRCRAARARPNRASC